MSESDHLNGCTGKENRALFVRTMERDAAFLSKLNLIDYSLLLGIHEHSRDCREASVASDAGSGGEESRGALRPLRGGVDGAEEGFTASNPFFQASHSTSLPRRATLQTTWATRL